MTPTDFDNPLEPEDHIPGGFQGKLEPNDFCRAWLPDEARYCDREAGEDTDSPGSSRCKAHSGPYGLDVAEVGGGDRLDLQGELEVARTILNRRLAALEDEAPSRKDLDSITRALREIRALVASERDRRGSPSGGATDEELASLGEIVKVAVRAGGEPGEVLERIRKGWTEVREGEE